MFNCLNWQDKIPENCARAVITDGNPIDIEFKGVSPHTIYKIYYLVTNDYPLRPIYSKQSPV